MKKLAFFALIIFVLTGVTNAQEKKISTDFSMGFQLNQFQNDFGLGLNFTTPYFANKRVALRLRGNLMFNKHISDDVTVWSPYSNVSLGMVGVAGIIGDFIRLYGEGGMITLFPSDDFSSESVVFGGYGVFGFEFYFYQGGNYFIEIGGIGTGAIADKAVNQPVYSNGLMISTGFRIHF